MDKISCGCSSNYQMSIPTIQPHEHIYIHMMSYIVFDYKMDSWVFPCWIHMKEWGL